MKPAFKIERDLLTPELRRLARRVADRKPILKAMGLALVEWTKDSFKQPARRPAPWDGLKGRLKRDGTRGPPRDGTPLLKSRALATHIHVEQLTHDCMTVAPAQDYGIHHQLGAPRANIPPRPFFPFDSSGRMMQAARDRIRAAAAAKLRTLLPRQ